MGGRQAPDPERWAGFTYRPELVEQEQERRLVGEIQRLPFSEVRLRGQVARRRTVHFGWLYGYEARQITPGPEIPEFLLALRDRAAELAALPALDLAEVLVTEYTPGASIGWHRDAPMFGTVVGVSLLGACRFRFRRPVGGGYETRELTLAPRSAYVLAGQARWSWQHSIPPLKTPRYSVTFRTLRAP